jgi:hypothetical protein
VVLPPDLEMKRDLCVVTCWSLEIEVGLQKFGLPGLLVQVVRTFEKSETPSALSTGLRLPTSTLSPPHAGLARQEGICGSSPIDQSWLLQSLIEAIR